jgi:hypothetical protein
MPVDIKQAVALAMSAVAQAYASDNIQDLLMEEFEKSEDGRYWLITISFARPEIVSSAFDSIGKVLGGPKLTRLYKVVKINAMTGEIVGMKIRET